MSGYFKLNEVSRPEFTEPAGGPLGQKRGKTTTVQTLSTVVTTIIGAGILGFPSTFARGGWFWSASILIACAWMSIEISYCFDSAMHFVELRLSRGEEEFSFARPTKYDDLCEAAFGNGGKLFATVLVNAYLLMVGAVFVILIGQNISFLAGDEITWVIYPIATVFVPMSLLDDMSIIARLSFIGVVASGIYAVSISIGGFIALIEPCPKEYTVVLPVSELASLGPVISVMVAGFTYQVVAPTVCSEMEKPREFPWAVRGAVLIVTFVYGCAGSIAYAGWGNDVADTVTESMYVPNITVTQEGEPVCMESSQQMTVGLVLAGAIVANLFVTFPIVMNCVYRAAETVAGVQYSITLRLLFVTLALFIGENLPFFLPILTLASATVGSISSIFLPMALYWKLAKEEGISFRTEKGKAVKHAAVTLLGSVSFFVGTYSAVIDLYAAVTA